MADQEYKINIVAAADNTGFKSATEASLDLNKATKDSVPAMEDAAKGSEKSELNHRALSRTLGELNRVIPGLGTALEFLERGYRGSAAGAGEATAANEEFLVSMGELAIVFLAIQAAVEYWQSYKDASKDALEAQTKAATELDDATKKMIDSRDNFNEAMNRGIDPAEKINKQLDRQTKIVQAQITAEHDLLKAREDAELGAAKTPDQKNEIKRRYEAALDQSNDRGDAAKTNLVEQAKLQARRQQEQLQIELDALLDRQLKLTEGHHQFKVTRTSRGVGSDREDVVTGRDLDAAKALGPKIQEIRKEIEGLKNAQQNYGDKVAEAQTVDGINQAGRSDVEKTQDSAKAISDAEALANKGPQNPAEAAFITRTATLSSGLELNLQTAEAYLKNLEKHPEEMGKVFDRLSAYNDLVLAKFIEFDRRLAGQSRQLGAHATTGNQ